MDEDQIYDDYLEETKQYIFPACRYWRDGEVLGDNLEIFINLTYGDPEVIVGVTEEDGHWVATIQKDGVEQEKKFLIEEVEVPLGGDFPYSQYPSERLEEDTTEMSPNTPLELPDLPPAEETDMVTEVSDIPDSDDSGDVQVESGEDNVDIDYGTELKSEGSIEDIPDDSITIVVSEDGYSLNRFYGDYLSLEDLGLVENLEGYVTEY